jgi:hypothetical protein
MNPITRKEKFLAKIDGQDVSLPDPITREEMFLSSIAKKGGAGGGASVQSDLSQNDPTAPDYVKNRTHYEEITHGAIIESQTTEGDFINAKCMPTVGKTYTVIFDGTSYECIAWGTPWGEIYIGNGSYYELEGYGEDVPFLVAFLGNSAYLMPDDSGHSIEVRGEYVSIQKLDEKFLPENSFTKCGYYSIDGEYKVIPKMMINDRNTDIQNVGSIGLSQIFCDEYGNTTIYGGLYTAYAFECESQPYRPDMSLPTAGQQISIPFNHTQKIPFNESKKFFWVEVVLSNGTIVVPLLITKSADFVVLCATGDYYSEDGTRYFVRFTRDSDQTSGETRYLDTSTLTIINKG